ncbi:unnamed protein product [Nesidiocoris tenuis]|uniref:Uncharacterized protein n=1 Tax=Nesidiocoris tenuis TaxID=355587 RepID=A0A6H5GVF1_9HEMI|nr:unnamed protein product [Nesidiocoris tenuis]
MGNPQQQEKLTSRRIPHVPTYDISSSTVNEPMEQMIFGVDPYFALAIIQIRGDGRAICHFLRDQALENESGLNPSRIRSKLEI